MRQRAISSVAVVILAVVPLVFGGPVFAALMTALGLLGYAEFSRLSDRIGGRRGLANDIVGVTVIACFGIAALVGFGAPLVVGLATVAVVAPLTLALRQPSSSGMVAASSLTCLGILYLGLPVYTAIALRASSGPVASEWLVDLANLTALAWPAATRGLAWAALTIFTIWIGDSLAYLAGRSLGRRPLSPRISPNKTIEGSLAGLGGGAVTALLCSAVFGLGLPAIGAVALGVALGVTGQLGDLIESLLKRQAGVKDSGAVIPGHGGILDRIDALLLTFPVAWAISSLVDWSFR